MANPDRPLPDRPRPDRPARLREEAFARLEALYAEVDAFVA